MHCQRRRGLLVPENFCDLSVETNSLRMATRCINCGCVEDTVVRANRVRRVVTTRVVPRRRGREGGVVFNHVHT